MSEKSGIQMIEEIMDKVELLDRRFIILEQMMKELLNRSNKEQNSIKISPSAPKIEISPIVKSEELKIGDVKGSKKDTRVMGKIKNKKGQAVIGVGVKVFDENNNIVKNTRTNKAGEWMCFLAPGKYIAEYMLKDIINSNVNFNITPGQTSLNFSRSVL